MRTSCGIRGSARRLFIAALALAALSLIWSAPALAQSPGVLGLGSGAAPGSEVNPVSTAVAQTVAPAVQTAAPVVHTAAPVVNTVTQPVAEATAPVVQAAAPAVQTVTTPVAELTTPVVQAAAPVFEAAAPILEPTAPAVEPLTGLVEGGVPPVTGTDRAPAGASSLLGLKSSPATSSTGTTTSAPTAPAAPAASEGAPVAIGSHLPPAIYSVADGASSRLPLDVDPRPLGLSAPPPSWITEPLQFSPYLPQRSMSSIGGQSTAAPKGTKARAPSGPSPSTPAGPSVPSSAAATFSGSGAAIFVAALVAALLLAVPGLSRRLRLELAPWPLPMTLPSLERPG